MSTSRSIVESRSQLMNVGRIVDRPRIIDTQHMLLPYRTQTRTKCSSPSDIVSSLWPSDSWALPGTPPVPLVQQSASSTLLACRPSLDATYGVIFVMYGVPLSDHSLRLARQVSTCPSAQWRVFLRLSSAHLHLRV
jgi:hypothetical protein